MANIDGTNDFDFLIGTNDPDIIRGLRGNDFLVGLEGDDQLIGAQGADSLSGGLGNDSLFGGNGADILSGAEGADNIVGGGGVDTAGYIGSTGGVFINLATGIGIGGDADGDRLTGVENLVGSDFDDFLTGDANANELYGEEGIDLLFGEGGNDLLLGGDGGDVLDGGAGDDTVSYVDATEGVGVHLGLNSGGWGDMLGSIENADGSNFRDFLFGSDAANRLRGLDGQDELNGLGGNDELFGGGGNDVILGGNGDDTISGGDAVDGNYLNGEAGTDTVTYADAASGVRASLFGGDASVGTINDSIVDFENVIGSNFNDGLFGDNGGNVLVGLKGNDELYGGFGDDVLNGGAGSDTLSGGLDENRFDFDKASDSRAVAMDRIIDFGGRDLIDLIDIDAITGTSANDAFTFIGTDRFSGSAGELRFRLFNGDTLVQGDVNGDGRVDLQIALTGDHLLTAGDFIL